MRPSTFELERWNTSASVLALDVSSSCSSGLNTPKAPPGANSGFYLRGRHEIQILDDFARGKPSKSGNGAIYNFKEPDTFASKPAGEWNTVEATIVGNKISVTMNGKKIHDNVACDKPTGSEIDNKVTEPGPIFLQGDHGSVEFRKIEIKELK